MITAGNNYGWPCWEGTIHTPQYDWGSGPGLALCPTLDMTPPVYSYLHPDPPVIQWNENVASISGLAGYNGRIYYNDYTVVSVKRVGGVMRHGRGATCRRDVQARTHLSPLCGVLC